MVHSVEEFLSKHPNTVYGVKTLARRTGIQKKQVFRFLCDAIKEENESIMRVKPIIIGSHARGHHFYKYNN